MMKIFDTHVHVGGQPLSQADLLDLTRQAKVSRTILLSQAPDRGHMADADRISYNQARLERVMELTRNSSELLPVHFINVIEADASDQAAAAIKAGIVGFKVICSNHYPGDERAMPVYRQIAQAGKPILFHSGILWDFGENAQYNRPGNFEALLQVPGLRFALAHIGWPWCDEMIAVFGKFLSMQESSYYTGQEMYIDLTPGTPPIYRKEALSKLLMVGYPGLEQRLLFGSDCFTDSYSPAYVQDWVARDQAIYDELQIETSIREAVFYENARTFWGLAESGE